MVSSATKGQYTTSITWKDCLYEETRKPYYQEILKFVKAERAAGKEIYPAARDVFRAFEVTPLSCAKVVIVGQDPYHGPGQANGLAFSVNPGVKLPPSLVNILKESDSLRPKDGDLTRWAKQGVLLLNTCLTVEQGKPLSHAHLGWQKFTKRAIQVVDENVRDTVFLLWGAEARKLSPLIERNAIISTTHPSPLSAHSGFLGSGCFEAANHFLEDHGRKQIEW